MELIVRYLETGKTLQIVLTEEQYDLLEGKEELEISRLLIDGAIRKELDLKGSSVLWMPDELTTIQEIIVEESGGIPMHLNRLHYLDMAMFLTPSLKKRRA